MMPVQILEARLLNFDILQLVFAQYGAQQTDLRFGCRGEFDTVLAKASRQDACLLPPVQAAILIAQSQDADTRRQCSRLTEFRQCAYRLQASIRQHGCPIDMRLYARQYM